MRIALPRRRSIRYEQAVRWTNRSVCALLAGLGLSSCGGLDEAPSRKQAVIVRGGGVDAALVQDEDGTVRAYFAPEIVDAIDAGLVHKQGGGGLPFDPSEGFGLGENEDTGFRVRSGSTRFSGSTGGSTRFTATTGGSSGFDASTVSGASFEGSLRSSRVTPTCDLGVLCSFASSPADRNMCRRGVRMALVPVRLDAFLCAFVDFFRCAVAVADTPAFSGEVCLPELQRVVNEGIRTGLFDPNDVVR